MALEGKVALVTGAGRGMGRATALALAAEGADVAVADIDGETVSSTNIAVRELGRRSAAIQADVGDLDHIDRMVNETLVLSQLGFGNCLRKRLRLLPFFRSVDVGGWQPWDENGMWSGWKGKNETSWND